MRNRVSSDISDSVLVEARSAPGVDGCFSLVARGAEVVAPDSH